MHDSNSCCSSSFKCGLIGFILGAAAGAVAAMFLTTKTGEELKADVKKAVMDMKVKVEEKTAKIKDMSKEKYEGIVDNVISSYKKVREFTQKELDLIKEILMEQKEAKE
jgi:gas vesicle protein